MRLNRAKLIAGLLATFLVSSLSAGPAPALAEPESRFVLPLTIAVDGGYAGWSDTEIQQRAQLGAEVTRHEWDPEEPVDEQDEVMEVAAGQIGTRVHALLGGNQLTPPDEYRQWVLEFIARYGLGGEFWIEHPELNESRYAITSIELGNEPYFGEMSPEEYAETVLPTLRAIEAFNLPVTVVLPSRVYGSNTSWMDSLYAYIPNLNELFDAFAEHPYWYGHSPAAPGSASPLGRIETTRERMDEHGAVEKPIWITEYGQSTAECGVECVSEQEQAQHLWEILTGIISHPEWGVKTFTVFQLRDRGTESSNRELQFGLLREDGSRKPAYGLVRLAVRLSR